MKEAEMLSRRLLAIAVASLIAAPLAQAAPPSNVSIGVEGAFPPWNMTMPDGTLAGFDIDLTHDLCRRAKLDCTLVAGDWAGLIPALNAGKFDLVLTLGINEARKKVVDFTIPYASGVATFLVPKDSPLTAMPMLGARLNLNDHAVADPVMAQIGTMLKGKTIGVVMSTSQEQLIRAYYGQGVEIRTYKSSPERDFDLQSGRIDAGFDSGVYGMATLSKPGHEDIVMAGPLIKGAMLATEVAFGLRKGDAQLKDTFDDAIRSAAADGTIRALSVKWSKLDLTPSLPAASATEPAPK